MGKHGGGSIMIWECFSFTCIASQGWLMLFNAAAEILLACKILESKYEANLKHKK